jgi:drug/metabolite transporter (DMT)-like permease
MSHMGTNTGTKSHSRLGGLLPWLALLTIYVVWGSTYLAIRVVVRDMPPFAAGSLRFFSAGLVMAGFAAMRDRAWPSRRQFADYALIGVLFLGIGNGLVMWAEQRIPSGIAALLVATVPLWMTFFDGLRARGQPWTLRVWVGTFLGLAGVVLVARPEGGVAAGHWPGILALQIATVSWSLGALYSQAAPQRLPVLSAAAVEMLAGAGALAFESWIAREDLGQFHAAPQGAWLALLYLAIFGSLVGFTAFAYCLHELPASTVGTYAYVNPVVAVALGAALLGESVSAGLVAGALLILLAVLLTTTGRKRPDETPSPAPTSSVAEEA